MDHKKHNSNKPVLGIIAGKGELPLEIAKLYRQQGGECYIVALEGAAELPADCDIPHITTSIGYVGAALEYFKKSSVANIMLIGGIERPNLKALKVDFVGSQLLASILANKFLGDNNTLKIIAKFFEDKGFKVISPQDVLLTADYSTTTKAPSKQDLVDIELGFKVLDAMSKLDIGQAVIVQDGYVIGIEAAEGTDNLIKRCAALRKNPTGGVLVKAMKHGQDARLDIPTIGLETARNLAHYQYNGVAIQKDSVIIANPEKVIKFANDNRIFVLSI